MPHFSSAVHPFSQAPPATSPGAVPFFSSGGLRILEQAARENAGLINLFEALRINGLASDPAFSVRFDAVPPWARGDFPMLSRARSLEEYHERLDLLARRREMARVAASSPVAAVVGGLTGSVVGDVSSIAGGLAAFTAGRSIARSAAAVAAITGTSTAIDIAATDIGQPEQISSGAFWAMTGLATLLGAAGGVAFALRNRRLSEFVVRRGPILEEIDNQAALGLSTAAGPSFSIRSVTDDALRRIRDAAGPETRARVEKILGVIRAARDRFAAAKKDVPPAVVPALSAAGGVAALYAASMFSANDEEAAAIAASVVAGGLLGHSAVRAVQLALDPPALNRVLGTLGVGAGAFFTPAAAVALENDFEGVDATKLSDAVVSGVIGAALFGTTARVPRILSLEIRNQLAPFIKKMKEAENAAILHAHRKPAGIEIDKTDLVVVSFAKGKNVLKKAKDFAFGKPTAPYQPLWAATKSPRTASGKPREIVLADVEDVELLQQKAAVKAWLEHRGWIPVKEGSDVFQHRSIVMGTDQRGQVTSFVMNGFVFERTKPFTQKEVDTFARLLDGPVMGLPLYLLGVQSIPEFIRRQAAVLGSRGINTATALARLMKVKGTLGVFVGIRSLIKEGTSGPAAERHIATIELVDHTVVTRQAGPKTLRSSILRVSLPDELGLGRRIEPEEAVKYVGIRSLVFRHNDRLSRRSMSVFLRNLDPTFEKATRAIHASETVEQIDEILRHPSLLPRPLTDAENRKLERFLLRGGALDGDIIRRDYANIRADLLTEIAEYAKKIRRGPQAPEPQPSKLDKEVAEEAGTPPPLEPPPEPPPEPQPAPPPPEPPTPSPEPSQPGPVVVAGFTFERSEPFTEAELKAIDQLFGTNVMAIPLYMFGLSSMLQFMRSQVGKRKYWSRYPARALAGWMKSRIQDAVLVGIRRLTTEGPSGPAAQRHVAEIELPNHVAASTPDRPTRLEFSVIRVRLPDALETEPGVVHRFTPEEAAQYVAVRSLLYRYNDDISRNAMSSFISRFDSLYESTWKEIIRDLVTLKFTRSAEDIDEILKRPAVRPLPLTDAERKKLEKYLLHGGALESDIMNRDYTNVRFEDLANMANRMKAIIAYKEKHNLNPYALLVELARQTRGSHPNRLRVTWKRPSSPSPQPEPSGSPKASELEPPRAPGTGPGDAEPPQPPPRGPDDTSDASPPPPPVPDEALLKLAPAFGLQNLKITPWVRVVQSRFPTARKIAWQLATSPGLQSIANTMGIAAPVSVETRVKARLWNIVEAQEETERLYLRYVRRMAEEAGNRNTGAILDTIEPRLPNVALATSAILRYANKSTMSLAAFRQRVGKAMLAFDNDPEIPEVSQAAKKWRALLEGAREDAADLELFERPHLIAAERFDSAAGALRRWMEKKARGNDLPDFDIDLTSPAYRAYLPRALQRRFTVTSIDEADNVVEALSVAARAARSRAARVKKRRGRLDIEGESYFPRRWKAQAIREQRERFRAILMAHFERTGRPVVVPDSVTGDTVDLVDKIIEQIAEPQPFVRLTEDGTGYATGLHERVLYDLPTSEVLDFVELDVAAVLRHHLRQMWTDVEITRTFGSPNMHEVFEKLEREIANEAAQAKRAARASGLNEQEADAERQKIMAEGTAVLRDLRALRDRLRGTYGLPDDPYHWTYRTLRSLKQFNAMLYLGMAPLSALVDVARPAMAWGFDRAMGPTLRAMAAAVERIDRTAKTPEQVATWRREARLASVAIETAMAERALAFADSFDPYGQKTWLERSIAGLHGIYFQALGLLQWTDFMKRWASMVVGHNIIDLALTEGPLSAIDIGRLARAHIGKEELERLRAMLKRHARKVDGIWHPNTEAWEDHEIASIFRAALIDETDRIIVTPGAADRPLWMSSQLGSVVSQFKSFGMAATWRVLAGGLQDGDAAAFILGGVMAVAAAWMSGELKEIAKGRESAESYRAKLYSAIDRSSLLGFFSDAANVLQAVTGVGPRTLLGADYPWQPSLAFRASQVLGPSVQTIANVWNVLEDWASLRHDWTTAHALRKLMIAQNMWYLDRIMDEFERYPLRGRIFVTEKDREISDILSDGGFRGRDLQETRAR